MLHEVDFLRIVGEMDVRIVRCLVVRDRRKTKQATATLNNREKKSLRLFTSFGRYRCRKQLEFHNNKTRKKKKRNSAKCIEVNDERNEQKVHGGRIMSARLRVRRSTS